MKPIFVISPLLFTASAYVSAASSASTPNLRRRAATSCDSTIQQARDNLGFTSDAFPVACDNSSTSVLCYSGSDAVAPSGCGITFCDSTAGQCTGSANEIPLEAGTLIRFESAFDCGAEGGFRVKGNLTLDCNAYTISTASTSTSLLGLAAYAGATVQNCQIQNFNTGLDLVDTSSVHSSLVTGCNTGISVEDSNRVEDVATVSNVYSIANNQWGLLASAQAKVAFVEEDDSNVSLVACGNALANVAANLDSVDAAASSDQSLICTETSISFGVCRSSNAYYEETCASAGYCG